MATYAAPGLRQTTRQTRAARAKGWGDELSPAAVLGGAAATFLLFLAIFWLWFNWHGEPGKDNLRGILAFSDVRRVGSVFYGTVEPSWGALSDRERSERVGELRRRLDGAGYRGFVLVDDRGVVVARWGAGREVELPDLGPGT